MHVCGCVWNEDRSHVGEPCCCALSRLHTDSAVFSSTVLTTPRPLPPSARIRRRPSPSSRRPPLVCQPLFGARHVFPLSPRLRRQSRSLVQPLQLPRKRRLLLLLLRRRHRRIPKIRTTRTLPTSWAARTNPPKTRRMNPPPPTPPPCRRPPPLPPPG